MSEHDERLDDLEPDDGEAAEVRGGADPPEPDRPPGLGNPIRIRLPGDLGGQPPVRP